MNSTPERINISFCVPNHGCSSPRGREMALKPSGVPSSELAEGREDSASPGRSQSPHITALRVFVDISPLGRTELKRNRVQIPSRF